MTGYLVDRQGAVPGDELVAVLSVRQRGARSRLVLRDNSLQATLTRPQTILRAPRWRRGQAMGVTWWMP